MVLLILPFFDSFRSSDKPMTFEEILTSIVDEDKDYQRARDEDLMSTLDHIWLGFSSGWATMGVC